MLTATLVSAYAIDPRWALPRSGVLRGLLAVIGAGLALWIVRRGAEVRTEIVLGREGVEFHAGRAQAVLAYEDIGSLDRTPSFGPSRDWLPALLLVDREGGAWRICGLIERGDDLVRELLARCARNDLQAWADARGLVPWFRRAPGRILAAGYGAAASISGAAALFWLA